MAATYLFATAAFVGSAMACMVNAPLPSDTAAGSRVPDTAVCVRASRYADYATARLVIGSPAREVETFIRLDKVVESPKTATLVWASVVSQSRTLNCNQDGSVCSDVAMVQSSGVESVASWMSAYFSLYADYNDYSLAGGRLRLKGMMYMVRGYDYYLTTTHLCWAPHVHNASRVSGGMAAKEDDHGYLEETSDSLGRCNGVPTRLFPYNAASESSWLALTDRYLFEHDQEDLELRRAVVESGTLCSVGNATLNRSLMMYSVQCVNSGSCQTVPSTPYRRLAARHTVHLQLPRGTDNAVINVAEASTMSRLPALLSASAATWIAMSQLAMLVLVAAVSFVRASQEAVSPIWILRHAFERCICVTERKRVCDPIHFFSEVMADALIGVISLVARAVVVLVSYTLLSEDNAHRVVISECVGCTVSMAHFVLRNGVLKTDIKIETPLTKLGGPMSTIDVSCAILVALAETPLLATRETFSSVGRMIASLLVLVSGVQTLVYSSAACCMTAFCMSCNVSNDASNFATVLYISTALWLVQTACVAVTLSTVFVSPFVYSLTRMTTGDTAVVRMSALLGIVSTALPTINRVTLDFVRGLVKKP